MTAPQQTGKAVAQREPANPKLALIKSSLERLQPSFQAVLPKHVTPDRMVRLALLAVNRQPALLECTPTSIAEAVMRVSVWGLEIGETAHIVAYGNQATAIADYKGLIEMAIRAKAILKCDARIVREGDVFEVEYGLRERIFHKPDWRNQGAAIGVYAIATLPSGLQKWELMSTEAIGKVRQRSRAKDKGPWATDFEEMAKKTVIKRLFKTIPKSAALAEAMRAEDDVERGDAAVALLDGPTPPSAFSGRNVSGLGDYEGPELKRVGAGEAPAPETIDMADKRRPTSPLPADPYEEEDDLELDRRLAGEE